MARNKRNNANKLDQKKLNELNAMAKEILEISPNSAAQQQQSFRQAMAAAISGGYDFADTLHNVYADYGYPANLTFSNFWNMYRRFGIAKSVVELPVDTMWASAPMVEGSEQFNREVEELIKKVSLWVRIKGLDTRQRVGRYAGLFMRVADGKTPDMPMEGSLSGVASLVDVTPLYESQLQVTETDSDPNSPTFGEPILLQYNQSAVGDRNEDTNSTITIHASRIVFAAEGADDGWIYGIPALEAVYNSLMDLRKIIGGGGEGFYKNAAQSIVFNLQDGASAMQYKEKLNDFAEQFDDFSKNRSRRAMWTPAMDANTLDSSLVQPEQFFNIALNDVAAGSGIPATVLIGKQTGRLASEEDSSQFLANVQSRRKNYGTELVRSVFDWLIKFGLLPSSEYDVVWDDLLARSDSEKLGNAKDMAGVNETQFKSGGGAVFTEEEIRAAAGFEPELEIDEGSEELPEDEELE